MPRESPAIRFKAPAVDDPSRCQRVASIPDLVGSLIDRTLAGEMVGYHPDRAEPGSPMLLRLVSRTMARNGALLASEANRYCLGG